MRDGKWSPDDEPRRPRGQRNARDRYLRSAAETGEDPHQQARDARRSARERAQLWKTIKAQH
jgi:hypothetical protein